MRFLVRNVFVATVFLLPSILSAGPGAGELSLDRGAVRDLFERVLKKPITLTTGVPAGLTLRLGTPQQLRFNDAGVEARIPLLLEEIGWRGAIEVRYLPWIEPQSGVVQLRPESAIPELPLPLRIDLAAQLPILSLPRGLEWSFDLEGAGAMEFQLFVQGVTIDDERLRLEFSLISRPEPLKDRDSR